MSVGEISSLRFRRTTTLIIVILLCGGDKVSQRQDTEHAKRLAQLWR